MKLFNVLKNIIQGIKNAIAHSDSNLADAKDYVDDKAGLYTQSENLASGASWTVPLPSNYRGYFYVTTNVESQNVFGIYALGRQSGAYRYVKTVVSASALAWTNAAGNSNPTLKNNSSYTITILILGTQKL